MSRNKPKGTTNMKERRDIVLQACQFVQANDDEYAFRVVDELDGMQRKILKREGCPICLRHDPSQALGPFVIMESKLMSHIHVAYYHELLKAKEIKLREYQAAALCRTVIMEFGDLETVKVSSAHEGSYMSMIVGIKVTHVASEKSGLHTNFMGLMSFKEAGADGLGGIPGLSNSHKEFILFRPQEKLILPLRKGHLNFHVNGERRMGLGSDIGKLAQGIDYIYDLDSGSTRNHTYRLIATHPQTKSTLQIGVKQTDDGEDMYITYIKYVFNVCRTIAHSPQVPALNMGMNQMPMSPIKGGESLNPMLSPSPMMMGLSMMSNTTGSYRGTGFMTMDNSGKGNALLPNLNAKGYARRARQPLQEQRDLQNRRQSLKKSKSYNSLLAIDEKKWLDENGENRTPQRSRNGSQDANEAVVEGKPELLKGKTARKSSAKAKNGASKDSKPSKKDSKPSETPKGAKTPEKVTAKASEGAKGSGMVPGTRVRSGSAPTTILDVLKSPATPPHSSPAMNPLNPPVMPPTLTSPTPAMFAKQHGNQRRGGKQPPPRLNLSNRPSNRNSLDVPGSNRNSMPSPMAPILSPGIIFTASAPVTPRASYGGGVPYIPVIDSPFAGPTASPGQMSPTPFKLPDMFGQMGLVPPSPQLSKLPSPAMTPRNMPANSPLPPGALNNLQIPSYQSLNQTWMSPPQRQDPIKAMPQVAQQHKPAATFEPKKQPDYKPHPRYQEAQMVQNINQHGNVCKYAEGRVCVLAKTKSGSRLIQQNMSDPSFYKICYKEMRPQLPQLMIDNLGRYCTNALIKWMPRDVRVEFLRDMVSDIHYIGCNKQGSFTIQAMMDHIKSNEEIELLTLALTRKPAELICHSVGHYVVLKFLKEYAHPYTNWVFECIAMNTNSICTSHYGLRVAQSAIDAYTTMGELTAKEKADGTEHVFKEMLEQIVRLTQIIAEDRYGNYLIQHMFDVCPDDIILKILEHLRGNFVHFCMQKFSSNVVERALRYSAGPKLPKDTARDQPWVETIVIELLASIGELIRDRYGNYCLQTALVCSRAGRKALLSEFCRRALPELSNLRDNVRMKWDQLLQLDFGISYNPYEKRYTH